MHHRFRFSTSGNPTKHMPIGCLSLWVQPRSVTSGDLSWPWNLSGAMSRVTSSHVLTSISSTIPMPVNRTTPSCVYSRFRWNLVEGCSPYDVTTSLPDLTRPNFSHQKFRKRCPISYGKFQRDSPNGVASSSEKLMGGGCINPPDRARVKEITDYYMRSRSLVFVCFLDARKAFDRVNHWTCLMNLYVEAWTPVLYGYLSHGTCRKDSMRSGVGISL